MYKNKLVVEVRVKEIAHKEKVNVGIDFLKGLQECNEAIIKNAVKRAKENHRTTIMARDIWTGYQ